MAAQVLRFPNFAPDRWRRLKNSMAQHGIDVNGDAGEFKKFGADVSFSYAAATSNLTLIVHHAPMFHSLGSFTDEIKKAVESQG